MSSSLYFSNDFHNLTQGKGAIVHEVEIQCPLCDDFMKIKTSFNPNELTDKGKLRVLLAHGHECSEYKPEAPIKVSKIKSNSRVWIDMNDAPL